MRCEQEEACGAGVLREEGVLPEGRVLPDGVTGDGAKKRGEQSEVWRQLVDCELCSQGQLAS